LSTSNVFGLFGTHLSASDSAAATSESSLRLYPKSSGQGSTHTQSPLPCAKPTHRSASAHCPAITGSTRSCPEADAEDAAAASRAHSARAIGDVSGGLAAAEAFQAVSNPCGGSRETQRIGSRGIRTQLQCARNASKGPYLTYSFSQTRGLLPADWRQRNRLRCRGGWLRMFYALG
jgi:hypothetical protein